MKMKKLLALLLALVMVSALVACGNDDVKDDDDDDDDDKGSTIVTTVPDGDPTDPPVVNPTDPPIVLPTEPGQPDNTQPQPSEPDVTQPTEPEVEDPTEPDVDDPTPPDVKPPVEGDLADLIVGEWNATISVGSDMMGQEGLIGELELTMTVTLNEDGTTVMHMHKEAYMESIKDLIVENLYAQLGGEAAAEQAFQSTMNMSCREYASTYVDSMADSLDIEDYKGNWSLNGDQLTVGETTMALTVNGDTMTWVSDAMKDQFGTDTLVLHRV